MKCLVTGATGFIGRQLCQLLAARGVQLTALSRTGTPLPDGTATVGVDLARDTPAPDLLAGNDAVFHLAGIAHRQAPAAAYERLNHQATTRLARQAAASGVKCFVFLSSVKAMGPAGGDEVRGEDDVAPPVDGYGWSKWRAECDLRREFADGAMSVVILRPALVYGPGAAGNLQLLARWIGRGLPRPPPAGARSMVACRDLSELMYTIALEPPGGVQTWIVTDGERYTTRDLYDLLCRAGGRGRGVAWLPLWGWRLAAAAIDLVRAGRSPSTFDRLFAPELYSNARLLGSTRWRPRERFDEGMAAQLLADGGAGP